VKYFAARCDASALERRTDHIFLALSSRGSSVIALTEGPLPDAHDYGHRDYVESFFDVTVDYANARRTTFVELAHLVAVDARRVGTALAAMVC